MEYCVNQFFRIEMQKKKKNNEIIFFYIQLQSILSDSAI